jgi:DNA repair protein RadD
VLVEVPPPVPPLPTPSPPSLRPYQQEAVHQIREAFRQGHRSVLFVLPTGGGKTVVFSHIAEQAAARDNRICILVHRQELLRQASASLSSLGVRHGLIMPRRAMDLSAHVQVASVQTLARRLHKLPSSLFQLLVIDEAHHSNAGTWAKVITHFTSARVLGVTATPCRTDGRGLGEWYSHMVLGPTPAELTAGGYLAPARVFAPPGPSLAGLRRRMGDYDMNQAGQMLQTGQAMGDCLAHYRQHLNGQTAIAFCCSVAHAQAVAELFASNGVAAASIDGTMDGQTRERLLSDLGAGRLKVLTSCSLLGEGVDVPSVTGCILLRPTQSEALHLQMIGRCLRPQPGRRLWCWITWATISGWATTWRNGNGHWTAAASATATLPRASRSARGASAPWPAPSRCAPIAGISSRLSVGSCRRSMASWWSCSRWSVGVSKPPPPRSKS